MIAVSSSGTSFRALATYLVHGRTGLEEGRIAWTSARNLPTADPQIAATLMRATAAQNVRIEQPGYHLALGFDPHDPVDRAAMERVADRVLARLGLQDHQALIVAHRDREHPHLHVLVNRVHPETEKAWDRWQDMPAIQRVLREEERALGLRKVPGHLHAPAAVERGVQERVVSLQVRRHREQGHADVPAVDGAGRRKEAQQSPLIERAQTALPAVRAAASWDAAITVLDEHGLRLERRGSGLVVTDGDRFAKASRVAPELTLRHLEQRLGAMPRGAMSETEQGTVSREASSIARGPERAIQVPLPALAPTLGGAISPAIARPAQELAHLERTRADAAPPDVAQAQAVERARHVQRAAAQERHDRAAAALDAALSRTYAEPERARAALLTATQSEGPDAAAARLRERPESYGTLATVERSRGFGLVCDRDDTAARHAAFEAATLTHEYVAARQALDASLRRPAEPEVTRSVTAGRSSPAVTGERARGSGAPDRGVPQWDARAAGRGTSPAAEMLERGLRDAVRKLTPSELQQLHALLTRPQAALAMRLRETVRDAVLGRERSD